MKNYISIGMGLFLLAMALSNPMNQGVAKESGALIQCDDKESYPLITKDELKKVIGKKEVLIVDVNSLESYNQKDHHVPGAIHFGSHEKDFEKLLPKQKDQLIIAYCGGVMCSAWHKAAKKACELGYTNIRHYKEGIKGWVAKD